MRITQIETFAVGAVWKNWLFVRVHTDDGVTGVGEGTLNGFVKTTEAAVRELEHLALGQDPRRVTELGRKLFDSVSNDGGHIHKTAIAAIEIACWDILGKSLGVPVHALAGGRVRDSVPAYANGWYRTEQTPEAFVEAAEGVVEQGFRALKLDPFGTARGFAEDGELTLAVEIVTALRERFGPELGILIDVHARFAEAEAIRAARLFEPLGVYWWEEPTTREREAPAAAVARATSLRVATGETFHAVGQFFTLASEGSIGIWQPEPMSLGGFGPALRVAHLAEAAGAWIAPHQSGGPVATAVCLQLAACVPNFLIQEHFDPFNEPWTSELVTWSPELDASGRLSLPDRPGLGLDLIDEVARAHPYDPDAYLNVYAEGWQKRLGSREGSAGD
jgi:galactonate dehydratase